MRGLRAGAPGVLDTAPAVAVSEGCRMWSFIRRVAVNTLVVAVSTVIGYLAFQLVFFRVFLTNVQLPVRPWLPETAGVIVQNTKAATVPRNYVAIFGDSYAEGLGDFLLKAGDDDSHGFHAAHVIREVTGWDVVSFGRAGAGSAEAFVLLPSRVMNGSKCLVFPAIGDPDRILAYFFEGNDIEDNLHFLEKVRQKYGRDDATDIDAYFTSEYTSYQWWRCHTQVGDILSRVVKFQYLYHTGKMTILPQSTRQPNAWLVAGHVVHGAATEGPALEVDGKEIEAAIRVFDRSLVWLRTRFPQARIAVVYIPSPLALYRPAGSEVEAEFLAKTGWATRRFPAERVAQRTEQICNLVRDVSRREQVGFINPGPNLREQAIRQQIHGPIDWHHFNAAGYRVFGEALARRLLAPAPDDCASAHHGSGDITSQHIPQ